MAVLTGAGGTFCSGADLGAIGQDRGNRVVDDQSQDGPMGPTRMQLTKPVIAAVHGFCVGVGLALVQAADLCVASKDAQLLYSEPRVGLAYGLVSGLAARIPHKMAMEVMLLGKPLLAERAERMGLVNCVVAPGEQVAVALQYAQDIAAAAPLVIRWLKEGVDQHVLPDSPTVKALQTMARVRQMQESADFVEGRAAFVERRPPVFQGK